mgnify:CR=1 FL=1
MADCRCGYADECDGQHATFYPLQWGGMCAVVPCNSPIVETEEEILKRQKPEKDY